LDIREKNYYLADMNPETSGPCAIVTNYLDFGMGVDATSPRNQSTIWAAAGPDRTTSRRVSSIRSLGEMPAFTNSMAPSPDIHPETMASLASGWN
jgi:hypothetical protein